MAEAVQGIPEVYQTLPEFIDIDESSEEVLRGMFEVFQDPETFWTLEDGRIVGRDAKGNVIAHVKMSGGGPFFHIDTSGQISSSTSPSVGVNAEVTFTPPYRELFSVPVLVTVPFSVGLVVGEDEQGNRAIGTRVGLSISWPPLPVSVGGPFEPSDIPTDFDPGG